MTSRSCLAGDGCRGAVDAAAPISLCERHFAVAGEWAHREHGVPDVLPSPCRACGSRLGTRHPSGWLCAVCEWRMGEIGDDGLAPPRVDVVYYLGYAERVKIGTTANPRQRFAAIRHDDLLALERGGRSLERHRHEQFGHERYGSTEWFVRSAALDAHIDTVRAGIPPWEAHARWLSEALALRG